MREGFLPAKQPKILSWAELIDSLGKGCCALPWAEGQGDGQAKELVLWLPREMGSACVALSQPQLHYSASFHKDNEVGRSLDKAGV